MRIIAVVNQKGGVGKTTTSVNLGAGLALRGRRVLLVDMDPQGNLTDHLLSEPPAGTVRPSVYDVLVEGLPVTQAVAPTATPGLVVVPSHEDMAGCELDLASVIGREVLLRDALAELPADAWDFVFLDCPPSLGLLSLNALAAANEVFIALQTEFFAMRGLSALDRTIELVRRRINPSLVLGGIVPTLVDPTRLSREIMDEVRAHYGERVFDTRIRTNVRLAEAPSYGKHIFEYAPDCAGATDYASLAAEVDAGARAVPEAPAAPARAPVAAAAPPTPPLPAPVPAAPAAATKPVAPPKPAPKRGIAAAIAQAAAAVTKRLGAQNASTTQGPVADGSSADAAAGLDGAAGDGAERDPAGPDPEAMGPAGGTTEATTDAADDLAPAPAAEPAPIEAAVATIEDPATDAVAEVEAHDADAASHLPTGVAEATTAVVAQALAAGAASVEPAPPADAPAAAGPVPADPVREDPAAEDRDAPAPTAAASIAEGPAAETVGDTAAAAGSPAVVAATDADAAGERASRSSTGDAVPGPAASTTAVGGAGAEPASPGPTPARRPVPALPVLKAGRPFGLGRMPLRPLTTSRAGERPSP